MTIKEIEVRSGMTRANIRFYEAEGLLAPARGQNGYRDYSEEDLEVLKRIKLLRSLRISLEEIKALDKEEDDLISTLDRNISALDMEAGEIDRAKRVCSEIRHDGANYRTLQAERYLDSLHRQPEAIADALATDIIPAVRAPWRRLFARGLDMLLYSTLWDVFLILVCNINLYNRSRGGELLDALVVIAIMLFVEPLLLLLFGTTLGKWILGLRVTDNDDRRLFYSEALIRTWTVLWRGLGMNVPAYHLFRLWKSYKACSKGETLDWEYDSTISLKDKKGWRLFALAGAYIVMLGIFTGAVSMAETPRHRGTITREEFCDNFNRLADYYDMDFWGTFDQNGKWIEEKHANIATVFVGGKVSPPDFTFAETNGTVTGISFQFETTDSTIWPPAFQEQMLLSALSFACTKSGFGFFSEARADMLEMIQSHPYQSFSFSEGGITVTCTVQYHGYEGFGNSMGMLLPQEGEQVSYSFHFNIEISA